MSARLPPARSCEASASLKPRGAGLPLAGSWGRRFLGGQVAQGIPTLGAAGADVHPNGGAEDLGVDNVPRTTSVRNMSPDMFRTSDIYLDKFVIRRQSPTVIDSLVSAAPSWATDHQPDRVQRTGQKVSRAVMRRFRESILFREVLSDNVFHATTMKRVFPTNPHAS